MNFKIKDISAGDGYVLAVDESDNLWAWGANNYGQLGNNSATSKVPIKVEFNI